MPDAPTVRSLADDIRGRTDAELVHLLTTRPDLARPAPADLTALAARCTTRASTARAVDGLDLAHLTALEGAAALDAPATPASVAGVVGVPVDEVAPLLDELWRRALLWRGPDGAGVTRTVTDVLGPYAAGLGPAALDLGLQPLEDGAVRALARDAPPSARAVLDRLVRGPHRGVAPEGTSAADGAAWLAAHGLAQVHDETVSLPREVALVLRPGLAPDPERLTRPRPLGPQRSTADADRAAGGAASELLALVDEVLATWSQDPPRVLRSGGLAVRDLATTAASLDVTHAHAAFVVELALAAGLLADDGEVDPHWAPTTAYDAWLSAPGPARWARLAVAWVRSTRAAHLVGRTGEGTLNALGSGVLWPPVRGLRRDVLAVLDEASPRVPTSASVADVLRWQRPRRSPRDLDDVVDALLREAEWLGVTGHGALSAPGRAAARGEEAEASESIDTHLPPPVEHLLLQADLTAIAPGPLVGSLAELVRLVCDIESRGGASVHRFSESSVRRILDAGWSAEQVLAALSDASSTPVPQPLDYLVRAVAQRHGQLRVSSVRACIRCDDPVTLDEIVASRELGALQLRKVSDTVVTSPIDATTVLEMLRDNGFAPLAETSSGLVAVPARAGRRAGARRETGPLLVHTVDDEHALSVLTRMREGEARIDSRPPVRGPRIPASDPTTTIAVLREAVADGHAVWIGWSDGTGRTERLLFLPERIDGGRITGTADGAVRTLSVHRITGAVAD